MSTTAERHQTQRPPVPAFRSQDPSHIRGIYAYLAMLPLLALIGFLVGFLT